MCPYAYYGNESRPLLHCKVDKGIGNVCIYSKMCLTEGKSIPVNGMEECRIMMEELKNNIPKGSNYIRFQKMEFYM